MHLHTQLEKQRERCGFIRAIVLKGRQQGVSTYIQGRYYWRVTHGRGLRAHILTHEQVASNNLFEMADRFHANCPGMFKPNATAANAKELYFNGIDSGYAVATAGNRAAGRSSTVQLFHGSEVAFWPNAKDHASGILQAVPREPGTEVILESTAFGQGNYFHEQWLRAVSGESDFIAVFIPWFWQLEYRAKPPDDFRPSAEESELAETYGLDPAQIYWRRIKLNSDFGGGTQALEQFRREYPCTAEEAFMASLEDVVIPAPWVAAARNRDVQPLRGYRTLWGVDVARSLAGDRSALAKRRANTLLEPVKWWRTDDLMLLCGKIVVEYNAAVESDETWGHDPQYEVQEPSEILVDTIGFGGGVVDRLNELGLPVRGINVAETASANDRYHRLRDELWFSCRDWFDPAKGGARLLVPEGCTETHDALAQELSMPKAEPNSAGKQVVDSKEKMKKPPPSGRGMKSPDLADALCLTFAGGVERIQYHTGTRHTVKRKRTGGGGSAWAV